LTCVSGPTPGPPRSSARRPWTSSTNCTVDARAAKRRCRQYSNTAVQQYTQVFRYLAFYCCTVVLPRDSITPLENLPASLLPSPESAGQARHPTAAATGLQHALQLFHAARLAGHARYLLHHLLHLVELLEHLVDFLQRRAAAGGDAEATAAVDAFRSRAFLGGHRGQDGLGVLELALIHVGIARQLAEAGNHRHHVAHRPHFFHLSQLREKVVE